jgi:hypothetical protein
MSKKTAILIATALILAAISLFLYFDSLPPSKIQIAYRVLSNGRASSVVFFVDPAYPMTRIKVTSLDETESNPHPHSLWEIVPDKKPVTKTEFAYGENIAGMKPFIPGTTPEALDPKGKYQLLVNFVKDVRGECTFTLVPRTGR